MRFPAWSALGNEENYDRHIRPREKWEFNEKLTDYSPIRLHFNLNLLRIFSLGTLRRLSGHNHGYRTVDPLKHGCGRRESRKTYGKSDKPRPVRATKSLERLRSKQVSPVVHCRQPPACHAPLSLSASLIGAEV